MIVIGTLSYILMGLVCILIGMRMRKGIGKYTISRSAKVSYHKLPLRERIRTSNSLLALGAALLLAGTYSLVPGPVMTVYFLTALFFFVLYVVIQRDLRRSAQEIARTRQG